MPKIQMSCPRCRQPLVAETEQLFDVTADPSAKQRFLSGNVNVANCPSCGYHGPLSTPVVYHDAEKELLLTYFPPELGLPNNEQERLIGPHITQVMNRLPPEKRKAYLLRPQTMFTFQSMVERVLENEGITKEMMDASQARLNLLQRLVTASTADVRKTIVQQEEQIIDEQFFEMVNRLIETSMASGDQNSAQALAAMQQEILPLTEIGRKLKEQSNEMQEAVKTLQEAGKQGLTREKLLDLMIEAPNETRLATMVSMARNGLDQEFLNILTQRIAAAQGEEQQKLNTFSQKITEITQEIDVRVQGQLKASRDLLNELLKSPNLEQAIAQVLPQLDDYFAEALRSELELARDNGDMDRLGKLNQVVAEIQKNSAPPAEFELAEELMNAESEDLRQKIMTANADKITSEFLQLVTTLVGQLEEQGQAEMAKQLQEVHRSALRFTMRANLNK